MVINCNYHVVVCANIQLFMKNNIQILHSIPLVADQFLKISGTAPVFLKLKEVISITKRCRSAIYIGMKSGTFPHSIPVGGRSVVWLEADIIAWQNNLVAASKLRLTA